MTGVATNVAFHTGLRAPASPGSIFAVLIQTASDSYVGVILSVILSATVSFLIAAVILRSSRKRDIANGLEKRTNRHLELFVRLLEPIMLLVMAAAILVVVAGLMLPVFKMSRAIG